MDREISFKIKEEVLAVRAHSIDLSALKSSWPAITSVPTLRSCY